MEVIVLANMNSRSRSLYAIARLSVVCLYPILTRLKFSAMFLRPLVPGHALTSTENFTNIVPGEPLRRGIIIILLSIYCD